MEEEIVSLKLQVQKLQAALNAGGTLLAARAVDVEALQSKFASQEIENRIIQQRLAVFESAIEESIQGQLNAAKASRTSRGPDFEFQAKFITTQLANATQKQGKVLTEDLKSTLGQNTLQDLTKRLNTLELTVNRSLGPKASTELSEIFLQDRIRSLESRLALFEKDGLTRADLKAFQGSDTASQTTNLSASSTPLAFHDDLVKSEALLNNKLTLLDEAVRLKVQEFQTRLDQFDQRFTNAWKVIGTLQQMENELAEWTSKIAEISATIQKLETWKNDEIASVQALRAQAHELRLKAIAYEEQKSEWESLTEKIRELSHWKREADTTLRTIQMKLREPTRVATATAPTLSAPLPPSLPPLQSIPEKALPQQLNRCFYSVVLGRDSKDVDWVSPFTPLPGWDQILFTNLDLPPAIPWIVEKVDLKSTDDVLLKVKEIKWKSHQFLPQQDVAVWVDAQLSPDATKGAQWDRWIQLMMERHIAVAHRPHPERDCVQEEAQAVIAGRRAKAEDVAKNMARIERDGMPRHFGLFDTNTMIRFHKEPEVKAIGDQMLQIMEQCSRRDQLAVTQVYWKRDFKAQSSLPLGLIVNKTGVHRRLPAF